MEEALRLVSSDATATPQPSSLASFEVGHSVQFYENEHFLAAAVSDYLTEGLETGQKILVVATAEHRALFTARLRSKGVDVDRRLRDGDITMLDAQDTLSMFLVGGRPDRRRFFETIGAVIDNCRRYDRLVGIRIYGEMVDLLWKQGKTEDAIWLEELWNDFAKTCPFYLLCAYAMGNFCKTSDAASFRAVCRQHAHVSPTEHYLEADRDARALYVSQLEQRAQSLESEIEHRKDLERRLRGAVIVAQHAEQAERTARAAAESANRAKSEFLAAMSHDLRTPLNAIGGHTDLLLMGIHGPITDAQREALLRVERSQRLLLSLINDVLNLARIEAGRVECDEEDVALLPLMADLCATIAPLTSAKHLSCAVRAQDGIAAEPLCVRGDSERIQQILLNLLSNAIKFTPQHGHITVSAERCADSDNTVCVHVADTGIGIPGAKLEKIFEPFVQIGDGDPTARQGVGLGLTISRELARRMGGDLTVDSEVGQGSTFTLRLPSSATAALVPSGRLPSS